MAFESVHEPLGCKKCQKGRPPLWAPERQSPKQGVKNCLAKKPCAYFEIRVRAIGQAGSGVWKLTIYAAINNLLQSCFYLGLR